MWSYFDSIKLSKMSVLFNIELSVDTFFVYLCFFCLIFDVEFLALVENLMFFFVSEFVEVFVFYLMCK